MSAQTQFYVSGIYFGALGWLPCYPDAAISVPENWEVPPIIGNYVLLNYGDGLLQPVMTVNLVLRDNSTDKILNTSSSGLLYYLLTRSADAAHDTTSLGTCAFFNGRSLIAFDGAKLDSIRIQSGKGDRIRCAIRIVGAQFDPNNTTYNYFLSPTLTQIQTTANVVVGSASTTLPAYPGWNNSKLLRFNAISFASPLANIVSSFTLDFANNHTPDPNLDGTRNATNMNAGMWSAACQYMVQAVDAATSTSSTSYGTDPNPYPIFAPIANGGSWAFTISNRLATRTITFTISNILNTQPYDMSVTPPRNMRAYACLGLGPAARTIPMSVAGGGSSGF